MSTPALRVNGLEGPPAGTLTIGKVNASSVAIGGGSTRVLVNGSEVATRADLEHMQLVGGIEMAAAGLFGGCLWAVLVVLFSSWRESRAYRAWVSRQPKPENVPYR